MIDPSSNERIKQEYLDMLDSLMKSIKEKAKSQGYNPDDNVSIQIGKEVIFKGRDAENFQKSKISSKQIEILNDAISNPENFKGSIQIRIGKDVVYHAKNGKLLKDDLGLSPKPVQVQEQIQTSDIVESASQTLKLQDSTIQQVEEIVEKAVQKLEIIEKDDAVLEPLESVDSNKEDLALSRSVSFEKTKPEIKELRNEISDLKEVVAQQQQVLQEQQQTIEKLQEGLEQVISRNIPVTKSSKLQNWLGNVESKVKKTAIGVWNKAKELVIPQKNLDQRMNTLQEKMERLDQDIAEIKKQIRPDLTNKQSINAVVKAAITEGLYDTRSQKVKETVGTMLHLVGIRNSDKSISFETDFYSFHQQGKSISIIAQDGREIMKEGVLTAEVNERDLRAFSKLEASVDEYLTNAQSQSESLGLRRGR
jgi:hypothetical protein